MQSSWRICDSSFDQPIAGWQAGTLWQILPMLPAKLDQLLLKHFKLPWCPARGPTLLASIVHAFSLWTTWLTWPVLSPWQISGGNINKTVIAQLVAGWDPLTNRAISTYQCKTSHSSQISDFLAALPKGLSYWHWWIMPSHSELLGWLG
jgi:hypothetical protein